MQNTVNIFLYGLSGAGKDTIANYLRDNYEYLKLRIAGTIKQYVFETYGFKTQEEFEAAKRANPDVRLAHNIFGNAYDKEGIDRSNKEASVNRLNDLINRTALEFEIMDGMQYHNICIVDVRTFDEAKILLNAGYTGIFLTRQNKKEFAKKDHKTEQNIFSQIEQLPNNNHIIIIRNHDGAEHDDYCKFGYIDEENKVPKFYEFTTDGTENDLLDTVCIIINNYIK